MEDAVVVDLKTASKLAPVHEAQLPSYLEPGYWAGLLINVHSARLEDGVRRMAN